MNTSVRDLQRLATCLLGFTLGPGAISAQTLYVPSGTGGVGLSANGNVGIGTTSPRQLFEVLSSSNPAINLHDASTAEFTIGIIESLAIAQLNTNGNGFRFVSGQDGTSFPGTGTEVMRVISGGNVGIGVSAPLVKLDIRGSSATAGATVQIVGNGVSGLLFGQDSDGGVLRGQGGNGELKFLVGGSPDQAASASGTEALRILSSGNVGIGTTCPTQELSVSGTIRAKEVIVDTGWSDYVFRTATGWHRFRRSRHTSSYWLRWRN